MPHQALVAGTENAGGALGPELLLCFGKGEKDGVIHPRNSAQRLISRHLLAFLIIQANKLRKTLFSFKSSSI